MIVLKLLFVFGVIQSVFGDIGEQRHINSVAVKPGNFGCRKKPLEKNVLIGGSKACTNSKPLKLTGVLKMSKLICAENWNICSITDPFIKKLSWKSEKMPKGCFAFNYGKAKAAGYGRNCHSNLYFDGVLCCPRPGSKIAHSLKKQYKKKDDKYLHRLNLVD